MNKKILKTVKVILWGLVYTLPLLHLLIALRTNPDISLGIVMAKYVDTNNFISNTILQIFGTGGNIALFGANAGIVHYFSYFVMISLIHICIDVILFLPDCARYIFDNMVGSKDEDSL